MASEEGNEVFKDDQKDGQQFQHRGQSLSLFIGKIMLLTFGCFVKGSWGEYST